LRQQRRYDTPWQYSGGPCRAGDVGMPRAFGHTRRPHAHRRPARTTHTDDAHRRCHACGKQLSGEQWESCYAICRPRQSRESSDARDRLILQCDVSRMVHIYARADAARCMHICLRSQVARGCVLQLPLYTLVLHTPNSLEGKRRERQQRRRNRRGAAEQLRPTCGGGPRRSFG